MSTSLPPRLSDQQQIVLAYLASEPWRTDPLGSGPTVYRRRVSKAVAHEQHARGERERPPRQFFGTTGDDSFSASLSRAIARLADRDLVIRTRSRYDTREVGLTDRGKEVGDELLRRSGDGRFALEFETFGD